MGKQNSAGMTEARAKSLAVEVRRATGHEVEVRAQGAYFVVDVHRAVPGDWYILRGEEDWQWLSKRTRTFA